MKTRNALAMALCLFSLASCTGIDKDFSGSPDAIPGWATYCGDIDPQTKQPIGPTSQFFDGNAGAFFYSFSELWRSGEIQVEFYINEELDWKDSFRVEVENGGVNKDLFLSFPISLTPIGTMKTVISIKLDGESDFSPVFIREAQGIREAPDWTFNRGVACLNVENQDGRQVPIGVTKLFSENDTPWVYVELGDAEDGERVWAPHKFGLEAYKNGEWFYDWEEENYKIPNPVWGWDYSHFFFSLEGFESAKYTYKIYVVGEGGEKTYLPDIGFTIR